MPDPNEQEIRSNPNTEDISFTSRRQFKQAKKDYKKIKKQEIKFAKLIHTRPLRLSIHQMNLAHNLAMSQVRRKYSNGNSN